MPTLHQNIWIRPTVTVTQEKPRLQGITARLHSRLYRVGQKGATYS